MWIQRIIIIAIPIVSILWLGAWGIILTIAVWLLVSRINQG